jgi:Na+/glutamate symporter
MPDVVPDAVSAKPSQVVRAEGFLWSAMVLGVGYVGADWKNLSTLLPSTELCGFAGFAFAVNAWLILRTSHGTNWARVALLVSLVLQLPGIALWRLTFSRSPLLVVLSAAALALQTAAMYLLFSDPGRRWFHRSAADVVLPSNNRWRGP